MLDQGGPIKMILQEVNIFVNSTMVVILSTTGDNQRGEYILTMLDIF